MEKETSCINSRAILDYLEAHYSGDYKPILNGLDPEIDKMPDAEAFLRDPNNWISCRVIAEMYRRARRLLDDELAPFKMARFAFQTARLGYAQRIYVKSFWSVEKLLKNAQKINDKWNRNKTVEAVWIGKNEALVRLHWHPQMGCSRDICLYNQGAYTAMPLIWGGRHAQLIENKCQFQGGPYCEYHLKWEARTRFYEIVSRIFAPKAVLRETIAEMERDKAIIEQKYEEVHRLNRQLEEKVKQLTAIQETGKAIMSVLDLDHLLKTVMAILANVCQIRRAVIMRVNPAHNRLEYLYGAGFEGPVPPALTGYTVELNRQSNILARVASTGRAEYVPDVRSSRLRRDNVFLSLTKPFSVLAVPLIARSKVIGVMAVDAINQDGIALPTRETIEMFAPQIAVAIDNAMLYRRLRDQMAELERSRVLLSRAEKLSSLGHLAAHLAHEIKNPLTAITTFLQMLPHKIDDAEFRTDFQKVALEEAQRVNRLITEMLDLVKPHQMVIDWADLNDLVRRMAMLVSPQCQAKKIQVHTLLDPALGRVKIDAERFKEVLLNIFANAVDFTPENGTIRCATRTVRDQQGSRARIEIRDSGPGIGPEAIDKVFDPFFTTKHKSNTYNGTGLGLFIAHKIMQEHGGTIEVQSQPDQGTTFVLTLPPNGGQEQRAPECLAPPPV